MIRLFLLLLFLYTVKCDQLVRRSEGHKQILKSMEHNLDSLTSALKGYQYPRFTGQYFIFVVNLMRLHVSGHRKSAEANVTFYDTNKTIIVNYTNHCLCLDFDATAIQNLLIFTTSTHATFTTCLGPCTFQLAFNDPMDVSFDFKVSVSSVKVDSKVIKAVGLGYTLKGTLELKTWKDYLNTILQSLVKSIMIPKFKTMYQNYTTSLSCYSDKLSYTLGTRASKMIGNRFITEYTKKNELMSNHTSDSDLGYYFDYEFINETYKVVDGMKWEEIKLNQTSAPVTLKKRLTTDYFQQVVPDLNKSELGKNLSITIKRVEPKLSTKFDDKAHQLEITNLAFNIAVEKEKKDGKEEFLFGNFTIRLVLEFILETKSQEIRLLPSILKREVKVTGLKPPKGYEGLKDGLKQIIEGALDDYYIKNYRRSTLCSGFMLTTIPEDLKIYNGKVHWEEKGINVTINY